MFYELMDVESGNLLGTYDTEIEALAAVRQAVQANGTAYVGALALGCSDDDGGGALIAEGTDLLARAVAVRAGNVSSDEARHST